MHVVNININFKEFQYLNSKYFSHLNSETTVVPSSGYFCPQCDSKYCEIPIECKACGLTLVCAPHLARSYHHRNINSYGFSF